MAPAPTATKKRLVVCCDGTWNRQDDGTNVLHVFHHVQEGVCADGVEQRRWYDEGVGTGVLDGVTGGAFGLGLERNVREAMNWLCANYDDGDELYVFGFSRGAFTARSLVAFLAVCGIPRRGAPLTVNQLWDGYCLHGRDDDGRRNWWEKLVGELALPFRNVSNLVRDAWRDALPPDDWRHTSRYKPWRDPVDLNDTERVLQQWTRRPEVAFLGLFDTVGSLGLDALAIPGLRSRLATHHNMRLHSLVANGRHALAIDEHRRNFAETPLSEWVPQGASAIDFGGRIVQRWFPGAHSNIGGGYPTNVLAQEPLDWILDGAATAGLVLRPRQPAEAPELAAARACLRDSYAEFGVVWGHVLRAKRHFRRIAPAAEARGSHGENAARGGRRPHAMRPIGDQIAGSAWWLAESSTDDAAYAPPNLVEFARRNQLPIEPTLARHCRHAWLGRGAFGATMVALWATCAAVGALHAPRLFAQSWPALPSWSLAAGLGAVAVLLDWAESRANFHHALFPERGAAAALRDVLFWCRAVGVAMAVVGAVVLGWLLWCALPVADVARTVHWTTLLPVVAIAGGALVATLLLQLERGPLRPARRSKASPWLLGVVVVGIAMLPLAVRAAVAHLGGWRDFAPFAAIGGDPAPVAEAGGLLLLELLLLAMIQSLLAWVGEPLQNARLGSVLTLQRCVTKGQLQRRLEAWRASLVRSAMPNDPPDGFEPTQRAAARLHRCLGHSLWRDTLGFVPLYAVLFACAVWHARATGSVPWLAADAPFADLWLWLPWSVAGLDLLENLLHGWFLRRFVRERALPAWAVPLGAVATFGKSVGFVAGLVVVHWVIFATVARLCVDSARADTGWRGALAILLGASIAVALVGQLLLWVRELLFPAARRHGKPKPLSTS